MNDEETVALIAGGHTFGKTHGAGDCLAGGRSRQGRHRGARPRWTSKFASGKAGDAITSGLEVTWTQRPPSGATASSESFGLMGVTKSPAGAQQCSEEWRRR